MEVSNLGQPTEILDGLQEIGDIRQEVNWVCDAVLYGCTREGLLHCGSQP